jgi:adenine phosphoribosyltransferase
MLITPGTQLNLSEFIRDIPNFPKPGITFKDITPLLKDPRALRHAIDAMAERFEGLQLDYVVGIESRGFIFGAALAYKLELGFLPIRKPGKLPYVTERIDYTLEYGSGALEIHQDALAHGERVLLIDDLLATGGTAFATRALVERLGGQVAACGFVVELSELGGRERLPGLNVQALLSY